VRTYLISTTTNILITIKVMARRTQNIKEETPTAIISLLSSEMDTSLYHKMIASSHSLNYLVHSQLLIG